MKTNIKNLLIINVLVLGVIAIYLTGVHTTIPKISFDFLYIMRDWLVANWTKVIVVILNLIALYLFFGVYLKSLFEEKTSVSVKSVKEDKELISLIEKNTVEEDELKKYLLFVVKNNNKQAVKPIYSRLKESLKGDSTAASLTNLIYTFKNYEHKDALVSNLKSLSELTDAETSAFNVYVKVKSMVHKEGKMSRIYNVRESVLTGIDDMFENKYKSDIETLMDIEGENIC